MTGARPSLVLALALTPALAGCSRLRGHAPEPVVRVDTVTLTKEVAAPLPNGDSVEICLSTGLPARVLVAANGDTLIGAARTPLRLLRPVLSFSGAYAAEQSWFATDTMRFEGRLYHKTGAELQLQCDELKEVGSAAGVPVFARVTEMSTLPYILVPVRPSRFQPYTAPVRTQRRRR
ncbi:MAG TPA: hypothetical protein VF021_00695 [Longimicrobiales bacterium]